MQQVHVINESSAAAQSRESNSSKSLKSKIHSSTTLKSLCTLNKLENTLDVNKVG